MEKLKNRFMRALENQYFEASLWIVGGVVLCTLTAYFFGVEDSPSRGGKSLTPSAAFLIGILCALWGALKMFLKALEIKE